MDADGTVMRLYGTVQWQQISDGCNEWAAFLRLYMDMCRAMRDISTLSSANGRIFAEVMQQADDLALGMTGMAEKYGEKASGEAPPDAPTTGPWQDRGIHSLIGTPLGPSYQGSRVRTVFQPMLTEKMVIMQGALSLATAPESDLIGPRPSSMQRGFQLNAAILTLVTVVSRMYQLLSLV